MKRTGMCLMRAGPLCGTPYTAADPYRQTPDVQGLGTSAHAPAFAPAPAPAYGPPAAPKASDSLARTNSTVNQLQVGGAIRP